LVPNQALYQAEPRPDEGADKVGRGVGGVKRAGVRGRSELRNQPTAEARRSAESKRLRPLGLRPPKGSRSGGQNPSPCSSASSLRASAFLRLNLSARDRRTCRRSR